METGVFYRKLKQLNPRLRIWCGDDDSKPAGLYHIKNGEFTEICGVDKGDIPERMIYRADGSILKSGWRRTLKVLIKQRLIDKAKAEKVFHYSYETRKTPRPYRETAEDLRRRIEQSYS